MGDIFRPMSWRQIGSRYSCERGFTLLEVVLAVALFSILAAIALPNWTALVPGFRLSGAGRQIQSELHRTKARAVSGNSDFRLVFASTNYAIERRSSASWEATGEKKPFPDGIEIRSVTVSGLGFTPRGTPTPGTGGTVKLCNGTGVGRNVVVGSTGRVRICKPDSCNGSC
jgi:prepilin-type N-terminal cleavage/methylation domain-containing protein